jgi:predicted nucleotidyltransferase
MDTHDESILLLWTHLANQDVRYIMIGGFAVNIHGFSRFTADVDILIEDSLVNRKKFRSALKDAGIGDFELLETMDIIPGYTTILLDNGMELDIFTKISGFEENDFSELFEQAVEMEINNITVKFLHLNHLIHTKKMSNRPKDSVDIEELKKINNKDFN